MKPYSAWKVFVNGLTGQKGWDRAWRDPEPKAEYDVVIVGAGLHGLATAYYLAKNHDIKNIAVVEKGWLGGGNTGRNTTIIRSNYLYDESAAIYDHAVKLWQTLSQELNYNVMYSPRGVMMLAHNVHDVQSAKRHVYANRLNGVDNEWLTPKEAKAFCPPLNISRSIRYPVLGAALQRRGGVARHDAVAMFRATRRFCSISAAGDEHADLSERHDFGFLAGLRCGVSINNLARCLGRESSQVIVAGPARIFQAQPVDYLAAVGLRYGTQCGDKCSPVARDIKR